MQASEDPKVPQQGTPQPSQAPSTPSAESSQAKLTAPRSAGLGWLSVILIMVLAAGGGYWFSQRMDRVETSAARRLQGADQRIVQLEAQTKLYQDEMRELG